MRILPSDSPYKNEPFFFAIAFPLTGAKGEDELPLRSPDVNALSPVFAPEGNYCRRPCVKHAKRKINIFGSARDKISRSPLSLGEERSVARMGMKVDRKFEFKAEGNGRPSGKEDREENSEFPGIAISSSAAVASRRATRRALNFMHFCQSRTDTAAKQTPARTSHSGESPARRTPLALPRRFANF